MATTTPNFGWPVPTSTDLVKDGATAIEALGDSIDASLLDLKGGTSGQVLAKNSNTDMDFIWVTDAAGDITGVTAGTGISGGGTSGTVTVTNSMATAIDAKGDLIGGTGADTFARLAVGTNGQVLTADSAETTGLKWATAAGGAKSFALLNSGGTSLSGSTTTISSIGGYDQFLVLISSASTTSSNVDYTIRFNSDTGSNYSYYGAQGRATTNYESANIHTAMQGASQTSFLVSTGSNDTGSASSIGMLVSGANTAGVKIIDSTSGATANGGVNHYSRWIKGIWNNTSVVSSISIIASAGTFDTGTIFIYGAV